MDMDDLEEQDEQNYENADEVQVEQTGNEVDIGEPH